jgi:hypothetical protein
MTDKRASDPDRAGDCPAAGKGTSLKLAAG